MNEWEISEWLDGIPVTEIHRNRRKQVCVRRDLGTIVSVIRFPHPGALDEFQRHRDALRAAAGRCPALCIPETLRVRRSEGESLLAETMPRGSTIGPIAARIDALYEGLSALHTAGWTHMDVKPENLLCFGGCWRLIDFDGAMRLGDTYDRRQITYEYAPPEARRYDRADGQDDLYAMALMLYEERNQGRLPFQRNSRRVAVWLRNHVRRVPPPPRCSRSETRFFEKALAWPRTARFATIDAQWMAWQAAINDESE